MRMVLILLMAVTLYADISKLQEEVFGLKEEQANVDNALLKSSFINPLTLSATLNRTNFSFGGNGAEQVSISLSQDIFRSGNIFYLIDYASLSQKIALDSLKKERLEMLATIEELRLTIQKSDKTIQKQKLLIRNAKLNVAIKDERYVQGVGDIADLDEAMITLNELKNTLEQMQATRQEYLYTLSTLSDEGYCSPKESTLPSLDRFLSRNVLQIAQDEVALKKIELKMQEREFFPTLSAQSSYAYNSAIHQDTYSVGLTLSMPLDFFSGQKIQSKKVAQMIEKLNLAQSQKEERALYDTTLFKIQTLDNERRNSEEIIKRYDGLIEQVKELYAVGLKTKEDLQMLQNTQQTKRLESEIFAIEQALLHLGLVKRMLD
jgi:outer membrane protein TolC